MHLTESKRVRNLIWFFNEKTFRDRGSEFCGTQAFARLEFVMVATLDNLTLIGHLLH